MPRRSRWGQRLAISVRKLLPSRSRPCMSMNTLVVCQGASSRAMSGTRAQVVQILRFPGHLPQMVIVITRKEDDLVEQRPALRHRAAR